MGLHLCYRLLLPGATTVDEVRSKIAALKAFADTIGFDRVRGPEEYTTDDLDEIADPPDIGQIVISSMAGDPPDFYGVGFGEPCAVTFAVEPGDGCDPAIIGLIAPGSRSVAGRPEDDLHPGEWFWSGACGTSYAVSVSDEHFIKCHAGLVRLLDHASTLGIGVHVEDETGYWEHRSPERALQMARGATRMETKRAEEAYLRWLETHPRDGLDEEFEHDLALTDCWWTDEQADGSGPTK